MSALIKPNQTISAQDLSQQNINPTRSPSWVLLELCMTGGVLIHKIHGHIFAAASNFGLTQECFFQTRRLSEDLCENSSLYRRGCPSSAPNRIHKGLSNIKLKLFSLEILHKRVNWHAECAHTLSLCADDSKPYDRQDGRGYSTAPPPLPNSWGTVPPRRTP